VDYSSSCSWRIGKVQSSLYTISSHSLCDVCCDVCNGGRSGRCVPYHIIRTQIAPALAVSGLWTLDSGLALPLYTHWIVPSSPEQQYRADSSDWSSDWSFLPISRRPGLAFTSAVSWTVWSRKGAEGDWEEGGNRGAQRTAASGCQVCLTCTHSRRGLWARAASWHGSIAN
jgi:hypothetical protein